jgi:5-methylcytosine-specific restriction endonuclease McrA
VSAPVFCRGCGEAFGAVAQANGTVTTCCSLDCARVAKLRRYRHVSRARRCGASVVEPVYLGTVAARDGWSCRYCVRVVTRDDWSLEHLVPLWMGGEHSYANVALTHHICNLRRNAEQQAGLAA